MTIKAKLSHHGEEDQSHQGCLSRQRENQQMVSITIRERPGDSIQMVYECQSTPNGNFYENRPTVGRIIR